MKPSQTQQSWFTGVQKFASATQAAETHSNPSTVSPSPKSKTSKSPWKQTSTNAETPRKNWFSNQTSAKKLRLVKFYPGLDPAIIDFYVEKGFKGILLEGSGLGHVSKFCFDAIKNAVSKGVLVALASQCIWGRVNMNVYDTGRDLLSFGVVPLDDMFPETGAC